MLTCGEEAARSKQGVTCHPISSCASLASMKLFVVPCGCALLLLRHTGSMSLSCRFGQYLALIMVQKMKKKMNSTLVIATKPPTIPFRLPNETNKLEYFRHCKSIIKKLKSSYRFEQPLCIHDFEKFHQIVDLLDHIVSKVGFHSESSPRTSEHSCISLVGRMYRTVWYHKRLFQLVRIWVCRFLSRC